MQIRISALGQRPSASARACPQLRTTLRNQTQDNTTSVQCVPGMRFLVVYFGVYYGVMDTITSTPLRPGIAEHIQSHYAGFSEDYHDHVTWIGKAQDQGTDHNLREFDDTKPKLKAMMGKAL
eukprot:159466-Rhodomonas_salina.2